MTVFEKKQNSVLESKLKFVFFILSVLLLTNLKCVH